MTSTLARFHELAPDPAARELLACCGCPAWAEAMAAGRPYAGLDAVLSAADAELAALEWRQVEQALAAHPRIGERPDGDGTEAAWSRREQAAAATGDAAVRAELAAATAAYEDRFGRVFLICADGKDGPEILRNLESRLHNDESTERSVVRAELRGIVRLRLQRWLA